MTGRSARFALPFILPGQAQKELFHNEAIAMLDGLVHAAVEGSASVPPDEPADGESWLVEAGGSGAWTGRDHALACFTSAGWRFAAPIDGMSVWDKSARLSRRWITGAWGDGTINVAAVEIVASESSGLDSQTSRLLSLARSSTLKREPLSTP